MARPAKRAPAFQAPSNEDEVIREAPTAEPARVVRRRGKSTGENLPAYRVGCVHLGAWVNDKAARQFKAMAMERGIPIREAFIEMLNAEFARRGRPTIAD